MQLIAAKRLQFMHMHKQQQQQQWPQWKKKKCNQNGAGD